MKKLLTLALLLLATAASAAPPVKSLYHAALQREIAVRASLAAPDAGLAVLTEVRGVVAAYESIVKHYPGSGYSDNALWQAGRLELDAFETFGQPRDKDAGVRLLQKLATVYVTSKLAKQVPAQLARVSGDSPTAPAAPVAAAPPNEERPTPAAPAGSGRLATIKDIRRTILPDAVRVTIEFDAEVPFHDERIADPARVFVDLPGTRATPALVDRTLRFEGDADIVRQIRVGRHPNNTTRVVLDAAGLGSYGVYPLYDPFRLVIDCVRATTAADVRAKPDTTRTATPAAKPMTSAASSSSRTGPTPPLRSHPLPAAVVRRAPSLSPHASTLIADARAALTAPPVAVDPAPKIAEISPVAPIGPTTPPTKNMNGGFSIARQLGLGVSRIVIDAGHGGHDPGAQGKGVTEAELVLDIALRVEKLLQKVPGVEVILTRRTDEFIPLQERTAIANREGADLFLSIHANASPNPQARGIETYFLNFATNLSAAAVAARENAASGQAMGALPDIVKAIALNNKLDESKDFATQVQRAMLERLRGPNRVIKDLGVKQAPFVVLIGAAMPSVLAEISFVTNTQEARLLKSNAYRQRIAEALFNAIRKYQTSLKNATTVALQ